MGKELLPTPSPTSEMVKGHFADVIVEDLDTISGLTDRPDFYELVSDETELELPVEEISFQLVDDPSEERKMIARAGFDGRHLSNPGEHTQWRTGVVEALEQQYSGDEIKQIPHDSDAIYIDVGGPWLIRITTHTDIDQSHLMIETIGRDRVVSAVDHVDHSDADTSVEEFKKLFTKFLEVWVCSYDALLDKSASAPSKHSIVLKAPPEYEPSDKARPEIPTDADPTIKFEHFGGTHTVISRLRDYAELFGDNDALETYGVSTPNLLLHGEAGVGKTDLVHAFANEIGAVLRVVTSTEIFSKWTGEAGKNLDKIFSEAVDVDHSVVVFFDKFETLGTSLRNDSSPERRDAQRVFASRLDRIKKQYPNVLVAAATSADISDLEPSLVGGGGLESIAIKIPDEADRVEIWSALLTKRVEMMFMKATVACIDSGTHESPTLFSSDINPIRLAQMTNGMTASDFGAIIDIACIKAYRVYKSEGEMCPVSQSFLESAVIQYRQR